MAPTKKEPEPKPVPPTHADVFANHYQKTFEIAYEYGKERNKLFVSLVLTAGVGLMLLMRVPTADALLVAAIIKFLNITDPILIASLKVSFPFNILLSGILVGMFYLMQRLHTANLSVMRTYMYIGGLEAELRGRLGLKEEAVSFTREGGFYWGKRTLMQAMSKYYYSVVLFIILVPFIVFKLTADFASPNYIIIAVDFIVSAMSMLYWREYANSSFLLDKPKLGPTDKKA